MYQVAMNLSWSILGFLTCATPKAWGLGSATLLMTSINHALFSLVFYLKDPSVLRKSKKSTWVVGRENNKFKIYTTSCAIFTEQDQLIIWNLFLVHTYIVQTLHKNWAYWRGFWGLRWFYIFRVARPQKNFIWSTCFLSYTQFWSIWPSLASAYFVNSRWLTALQQLDRVRASMEVNCLKDRF